MNKHGHIYILFFQNSLNDYRYEQWLKQYKRLCYCCDKKKKTMSQHQIYTSDMNNIVLV